MSEQPFRDINPINNANTNNSNESSSDPNNLKPISIAVGSGNKAMFTDARGTWWGNQDPSKAPVFMDMEGNWTLRSTALGGGYIKINAALTQFLVNDGTTDRILIGRQVGGF